jgi:methane monooxygenase PmoA-like
LPSLDAPPRLRLVHEESQGILGVQRGDQSILSYIYRPDEPEPPYFHPLHTLRGNLVSLYRPHDHPEHRGLSWTLPDFGRPHGDLWFGVARHRSLVHLDADRDGIRVTERLHWLTQPGRIWFREQRRFSVTVDSHRDAWTLTYATTLTNVSERRLVLGNRGGGLLWRGPRSFTDGRVYTELADPPDLRMPWVGFAGRHDGSGDWSTLVFVNSPTNPARLTPGAAHPRLLGRGPAPSHANT